MFASIDTVKITDAETIYGRKKRLKLALLVSIGTTSVWFAIFGREVNYRQKINERR